MRNSMLLHKDQRSRSLTSEREISIAKRIDAAEQVILRLVVSFPVGREVVASIFTRFLDHQLRAREVYEDTGERGEMEETARNVLDEMPHLGASDLAHRLRNLPLNRRQVYRVARAVLRPGSHAADGENASTKRRRIERLLSRIRKLKNVLIESHFPLVVGQARSYEGRGLAFADLVQEGNLGLMHAADKFDWRPGFRFATYARWWVRQNLSRAISDQSSAVRLPINLALRVRELVRLSKTIEHETGEVPTPEQLAAHAKVSAERVRELLGFRVTTVSLDAPVSEEQPTPWAERLADQESVDPTRRIAHGETSGLVREALETLRPREAEVLRMRFGIDQPKLRTLAEVGEIMGLSRERIRQIESRALQRLRHPSRMRALSALR